MPVPNTFANATTSIPLSQLDANFATPITLGNTAIQLGNTVTTLNNMTLANVTVNSGNLTTSTVTVGAGSNTAPSITFSGDTNTGIYSPAADTIAFTEGGVEAMRITASGQLGLGTTSPTTKMTIADAVEAGTRYLGNGLTSAGLFVGYNGAAYVFNDSNTPMIFGTNGSERMRLTPAGLLGLGTSNPGAIFQINTGRTIAGGSGGAVFTVDGLNNDLVTSGRTAAITGGWGTLRIHQRAGDAGLRLIGDTSQTANYMDVENAAGSNIFVINSSGNVGIGTSSPAYRLTLVGGAAQISPGSSAQEGVRIQRTTGVCSFSGINADNNAYNALSFAAGVSEAIRIATNGFVGFGTSSPDQIITTNSASTGVNSLVSYKQAGTTYGYSGMGSDNRLRLDGIGVDVGLGTSGANYAFFYTSGTERMRIDASGNVGIGTSSPTQRLHVVSSSGGTTARFANVNTGNFIDFVETNTSTRLGYIGTTDGTNWTVHNDKNGYIAFDTNNLERMRIDASGNVGIGTSAPLSGLQVSRGASEPVAETGTLLVTGSTTAFRLAMGYSSVSNAGWVQSVQNGVNATPLLLNPLGGNVGIGTSSPLARLHVRAATNQNLHVTGAINVPNAIVIAGVNDANNANIPIEMRYTSNFVFVDAGTERARIATNGDWMVGTTVRLDQATNASGLSYVPGDFLAIATTVSGHSPIILNKTNSQAGNCILFRYNGTTQTGAITNTSTTTTYSTSSDYRLKENVVPLTRAAARVQALKPSRFNFIADPDRTVDGFIAHEAAQVVPEAVTGEKDAVNEDGSIKAQGIDQSKLVPLLTAALQEALTEIASLKARVAALENK